MICQTNNQYATQLKYAIPIFTGKYNIRNSQPPRYTTLSAYIHSYYVGTYIFISKYMKIHVYNLNGLFICTGCPNKHDIYIQYYTLYEAVILWEFLGRIILQIEYHVTNEGILVIYTLYCYLLLVTTNSHIKFVL